MTHDLFYAERMGVKRRKLPYAAYVEAKDRKKKIWEQETVGGGKGKGRETEGKREGGTSEEEEVYRRKRERKEEKRAQE